MAYYLTMFTDVNRRADRPIKLFHSLREAQRFAAFLNRMMAKREGKHPPGRLYYAHYVSNGEAAKRTRMERLRRGKQS